MSDHSNREGWRRASAERFIRENRRLYLVSTAAFTLISSSFVLESYLIGHSPRRPEVSTGQTVQMKVRGGNIFVRPAEYYLNRGGYLIGVATFVSCLVAGFRESMRRPPS